MNEYIAGRGFETARIAGLFKTALENDRCVRPQMSMTRQVEATRKSLNARSGAPKTWDPVGICNIQVDPQLFATGRKRDRSWLRFQHSHFRPHTANAFKTSSQEKEFHLEKPIRYGDGASSLDGKAHQAESLVGNFIEKPNLTRNTGV